MTARRLAACLVGTLLLAVAARADATRYGDFRHDSAMPHVLMFRGDIGRSTLRDFREATKAHQITLLLLDSPGGRINASLDLARMIRARQIATAIPDGAECASACAFLFVAGARRQAEGRLGVHQFTSEDESRRSVARTEAETQATVARIVTLLTDLGAGPDFFMAMFRTPNSGMHWFSPAELNDKNLVTGDDFAPELAAWRAMRALETTDPVASVPAPPPGLPPAGAPPVIGPGFDCAASDEPAERLICADARLAALDFALSGRVDRLARRMGALDAVRFRLEQLGWTATRNACAADHACIEAAYIDRLDTLGY